MVQNAGGLPKETVRFPHFMPEKDMQDILAPEDHKQGTLSKDRTTGHHHGTWSQPYVPLRRDEDYYYYYYYI